MGTDHFGGKTALVTGAARGIGLATAEALAHRGARVVLADILEGALSEACARLAGQGFEVLGVCSDVSSPQACETLVQTILTHFGGLDILVNNAGVSIVARFEECRPEVCRQLLDVNLLGSIYMTLAALNPIKRARGHLVFVSSVSGIRSIPTGSVYSASKAALRSLAESLRLELKPFGVHVGVVSPGFTTSDAAKTVMSGDGSPRPIARPPHDTPEGVARAIVGLIEGRERERVLTPMGKATALLQRVSPALLDRILASRELKN
jgi:NAD(P)-dependent dehydrogenase (short-subunit alcohol dehydrogenase family)